MTCRTRPSPAPCAAGPAPSARCCRAGARPCELDSRSPHEDHGILQAAAAVAAEQPAPTHYRYTRMLSRFVDDVRAGDEHGRVTYEQTSENWTSDGFRGRTVAPQGTVTWASP